MNRLAIWFSVLLALSTTAYRIPSGEGGDVQRYAEVSNEVGYRLQRAQSGQSGNQLISPYGISTILSVLYQGTSGYTQQQIGSLGYGILEEQGVSISQSYQQLRRALQNSAVELEEATAILYSTEYSVSPQYQELLQSSYKCLVQPVDFSQRRQSISQVNRWIQEQTRGKLSNILYGIYPTSGIVVLNGVYYRGLLQPQSHQQQTQLLPFYGEALSSQAGLYYQALDAYPYYQDEQLEAVQLPLQDGVYNLLVVQPKQQYSVTQLQQQISQSTFQRILDASQNIQIRVAIPQFRLDYSQTLQQDIQSLGVTSVFGPEAQFSGVASGQQAYVSQIGQRSVVEIGSNRGGYWDSQRGNQQQGQYIPGQAGQYQYEGQYEGKEEYDTEQGGQYGQYGAGYKYQSRGDGQYQEQYPYGIGEGQDYGRQEHGYRYGLSGQGGIPELRANRPFLFYLIHMPTGLNVLAGRISQL